MATLLKCNLRTWVQLKAWLLFCKRRHRPLLAPRGAPFFSRPAPRAPDSPAKVCQEALLCRRRRSPCKHTSMHCQEALPRKRLWAVAALPGTPRSIFWPGCPPAARHALQALPRTGPRAPPRGCPGQSRRPARAARLDHLSASTDTATPRHTAATQTDKRLRIPSPIEAPVSEARAGRCRVARRAAVATGAGYVQPSPPPGSRPGHGTEPAQSAQSRAKVGTAHSAALPQSNRQAQPMRLGGSTRPQAGDKPGRVRVAAHLDGPKPGTAFALACASR